MTTSVNSFTTSYAEVSPTSASAQWYAYDIDTGEEVTVIFDVISRRIASLVGPNGKPYACDTSRLTSTPPFEFAPDNDCASDWEKNYLADYKDFHLQVVGPTGPEGVIGGDGPEGAQGAAGPYGPIGAIGIQGPVGPDGFDGADGARGSAGSNGQCLCPSSVLAPPAETCPGCTVSVTTSGFSAPGDGVPGQLDLGPGQSGTIRVEYNSCCWGQAIYVYYDRVQGVPGCAFQTSFLEGGDGNFYGNIFETFGALTINMDNPTDDFCSLANPRAEMG